MPRVEAAGSVRLGERDVRYEIVRSDRARHLRLRVGPAPCLRVIVPRRHVLGDLVQLLDPHRRWIFRQLDRLDALPPPPAEIVSGTSLPYRGADLPVQVRDGVSRRADVALSGAVLLVYRPVAAPTDLRALLEGWYRARARTILTAAVADRGQQIGVTHNGISIRDQRTRWASCSSRGTLSFNWRLVMAPPDVLDYVVVHELVHLIEPNHSPAFWHTLERWCPEYRKQRDWLKENRERLATAL